MVMHARKQPRLSDGYADRKEAHLHQPLQYPHGGGNSGVLERPHSSPFDRVVTEDSPGQRISPRYQNKSVFLDKNKEKEKKNLVGMPADKRVNHQGMVLGSSSGGSRGNGQSQGQGRYHDLADKSGGGGGGASSSGGSSSKAALGRDQREHKAEQVQKYAVRVCGDWSEHISSSGKRYYYNCKTEVSQWEKPREWVEGEPDRIRDVKGHYRQSTSRSAEDAAKHSSSASSGDRNDRPRVNSDAAMYRPQQERHALADKQQHQQQQHQQQQHQQQLQQQHQQQLQQQQQQHQQQLQRPFMHPTSSQSRDVALNSSSMSSAGSSQRTPNANHRSAPPGDGGYSKDAMALHPDLRKNSGYPYSAVDPSRKRPRLDSEGSRSSAAYPGQLPMHHKPEGEHGGHGEDMDISPGSTPTSRNCTPQLGPALQTLQKLQEALNKHIVRTQNNMGAQPPHNSHHHHPPQQSPHSHSHPQSQPHPQPHPYPHPHQHPHQHRPPSSTPTSQPLLPYPSSASSTPTTATSTSASIPHSVTSQLAEQEERTGQESPVSEMSPQSCSGSPELSDGSSQNVSLSTSALSGAAIKKEQQSVELTPSLANCYNERLIGHVMGWQADYAERQAQHFREEALNTASLHCSQVSVELKKARSLVRVGEIQATLHEQRLMFLDRQIKEIDSMKIPSSFLPP